MSWLVVAAVLCGSPDPPVRAAVSSDVATAIAPELQTGSLIFSRGDCLAVKVFSGSGFTHVAAVVVEDDACLVYDATGGSGVRRQTLTDYLASQDDAKLHVFNPKRPFTQRQAARFEQHLESELGRPYSIVHHLTGERAEGLHCSEYVTDALIAAGLVTANAPPRVSPASLLQGVEEGDVYAAATVVRLARPTAARPDGWCRGLWFDTRHCTLACYSKMRGWFLCR